MKYAFVSLLVSMMASTQAFAGAANADLNCKSADGKVTLTGNVPGDFSDFDLTATVKGTPYPTLNLYSRVNQTTGALEENGRLVIVQDLKNAVYTLNATDNSNNEMVLFRLYALPKTMKYQPHSSGNFDATFTGKLNISSENGSTDADVTCKLHYSI